MFDIITNAWQKVHGFVSTVPGMVLDLPLPWIAVGVSTVVTFAAIAIVSARVTSRQNS